MYEAEIAKIVADLGIEEVKIEWHFHRGKYIEGTRFMGLCSAGVGWAEIKIATGWPRSEVIKTIAHELRHAWQKHTRIYRHKAKDGGWLNLWTGTKYYPSREKWFSMKYWDKPAEVDARSYEEEAYARLFDTSYKPRRHESSGQAVDRMFRAARRRKDGDTQDGA